MKELDENVVEALLQVCNIPTPTPASFLSASQSSSGSHPSDTARDEDRPEPAPSSSSPAVAEEQQQQRKEMEKEPAIPRPAEATRSVESLNPPKKPSDKPSEKQSEKRSEVSKPSDKPAETSKPSDKPSVSTSTSPSPATSTSVAKPVPPGFTRGVISAVEHPDLAMYHGLEYYVDDKSFRLNPADKICAPLLDVGRPTSAGLEWLLRARDALARGKTGLPYPSNVQQMSQVRDPLVCAESFPVFMLLNEIKPQAVHLSSSALPRRNNSEFLALPYALPVPKSDSKSGDQATNNGNASTSHASTDRPSTNKTIAGGKPSGTQEGKASSVATGKTPSTSKSSAPTNGSKASKTPSSKSTSTSTTTADKTSSSSSKLSSTTLKTSSSADKSSEASHEEPAAKRPRMSHSSNAGDSSANTKTQSSRVLAATKDFGSFEDLPVWKDSTGQEPCRCQRSHCLKRYCTCFAKQLHCCEACSCVQCRNRPTHRLNWVMAYRKFVQTKLEILERPAFCRCGGSTRCLKRYCDCYGAGRACTDACSCVECGNRVDPDSSQDSSSQED